MIYLLSFIAISLVYFIFVEENHLDRILIAKVLLGLCALITIEVFSLPASEMLIFIFVSMFSLLLFLNLKVENDKVD